MDRGALRVIVHGVAKGQTQLNDKHTHTHTHTHITQQLGAWLWGQANLSSKPSSTICYSPPCDSEQGVNPPMPQFFFICKIQVMLLILWELVCVLVAQSCLTLYNPKDYNLQGSSVHGILQVRILEQVGLPFPSPGDLPGPGIKPRYPAIQADSLPSSYKVLQLLDNTKH